MLDCGFRLALEFCNNTFRDKPYIRGISRFQEFNQVLLKEFFVLILFYSSRVIWSNWYRLKTNIQKCKKCSKSWWNTFPKPLKAESLCSQVSETPFSTSSTLWNATNSLPFKPSKHEPSLFPKTIQKGGLLVTVRAEIRKKLP